MTGIEDHFPPFGLRIRCGRLELRSVREDDIDEVAALVAGGIYDPDEHLPFLNRWAEAPVERLPVNTMQFYWQVFAGFSPTAWHLVLAVRDGGRIVGVQDLVAKDFAITRSIETGSWLGRPFQGRGTGTLMRQAVCAFAFDELGAEQMTSGYLDGNQASAAVSRKVGYRPNGTFRSVHPDGDRVRVEQRVRLLPEDLVRPPHPVEVEGVEAFRAFIGL